MPNDEDITFDEEVEEPDLDISEIDYTEIAEEIDEEYEPLDEEEIDDHETEADPPDKTKHPSRSEDNENEEEEEDEEEDDEETEADLEAIVRDRLATPEDIDEADETSEADKAGAASAGGGEDLEPRRDDEFLCEGCFLLVTPGQFGSRSSPRCPSGEEICPAMDKIK